MRVYPFSLPHDAGADHARFPFFFDGAPFGDASSEDSFGDFACVLSLRAAGSLGFDSSGASPARSAFFGRLGVDASRVAARRLAHSRDVAVLDAGAPAPGYFELPAGDGFVLRGGGLYPSVTVADCLPVFLLDTESGAFGVLHSGWKGTGIAAVALGLMAERWGTRPAAVAAVLGPCIRGCCYAVDSARAASFAAEFDSGDAPFPLGPSVSRRDGRWFIDLQAANARLLEAAGVEHLAVCENCTFDDERLGSYRREGPEGFTRMVAAAGRFPRGV